MKKMLLLPVLLIAGLGVGGGASFATLQLLGPAPAAAKDADAAESAPAFVPADGVLAPLVSAEGRLTGYVRFDIALEVGEDKADFVAARLPLLLHAINMRTFRSPMASGPDGMLPNIEAFRKLAQEAANEAFGAGMVRRVAIAQATPA